MSRFDLFFILVDECNEVTDYAIARRIVDLHSRKQDSVDRVYSLEEVQRYVMFARLFKPRISKASADYMVEEYKRLRQRDCSGVTKSSWRITVRQLESMIRLSEAMSRMYCSDEVQPKHVKEAFRLLNKSIIRVETPDIDFEEDQQLLDGEGEDGMVNGVNGVNGDLGIDEGHLDKPMAPEKPAAPSTRKIRVTYEEYKSISNLLILHLRQMEETSPEEGGVRQDVLINWYLKEIESEIETVQELTDKKLLVEKVIDRLVHHDHVLLPLVMEEGGAEEGSEDNPYLVVHPNYVIES